MQTKNPNSKKTIAVLFDKVTLALELFEEAQLEVELLEVASSKATNCQVSMHSFDIILKHVHTFIALAWKLSWRRPWVLCADCFSALRSLSRECWDGQGELLRCLTPNLEI